MTWKLKCYNIDYDVSWEDVESNCDVPTDLDDDDLDEWYDLKVEEIKATLPKEVIIEVECDEEDLEDVAVDALSEETGWLINSYDYEILDGYSTDDDFNEDEEEDDELDEQTQSTAFFNVEIEVLEYPNHKEVWLANDGSSGCHYEFKTKEELKAILHGYVDDLVDYEFE